MAYLNDFKDLQAGKTHMLWIIRWHPEGLADRRSGQVGSFLPVASIPGESKGTCEVQKFNAIAWESLGLMIYRIVV